MNYNHKLAKEGLKPFKIKYVQKGVYLDLAKAYNHSLWIFVITYTTKNKTRKLGLKG